MPKTVTAPNEAAEPAGLIALRERIADMEKAAAAADAEQARLEADAQKLKEAALKRHAERQKLEREIARAEREALDIERMTPPPRISREIAIQAAEQLLEAFDSATANSDVENRPIEQRADRFWQEVDNCRSRLMTAEVDEDSHAIVLAAEALVAECDLWEAMRRPEFIGAKNGDGEELFDIRSQILPQGSSAVRALVAELRATIDGGEGARPIETVGELLGQNVSLNQVCKMHNLQLVDGSPDLECLAQLVDRALAAMGFYRESAPWLHLKKMGAMNRSDAWRIRSANLESRRAASHSQPGTSQKAGTLRTGRVANIPADSADNRPLHATDFRFAHYNRQRVAAEAAAQQTEPVGPALTDDQIRTGLRDELSRRQ